jgi:hypothetical protein
MDADDLIRAAIDWATHDQADVDARYGVNDPFDHKPTGQE